MKLRFTEPQESKSGFGRAYTYRYLKLPWDGDFANVMGGSGSSETHLLIGTEQGKVILFNLPKNKIICCFQSDEWISGVATYGSNIWSVGANKIVRCNQINGHKVTFSMQESDDLSKYPECGILFEKTHQKNFFIYNSGGMTFNIICVRTKKLIRKFDIALHLKDNECFNSFNPADQMIRSFSVSQNDHTMFVIVNRNNPHLLVFDYMNMKVIQWMQLHEPLNRQTHMAMSCILLKTNLDDILIFIYQTKPKRGKCCDMESTYKVLFRGKDSLFKDAPAMNFPGRLEL